MGEILKLGGTSFHPSAANTGNESATLLRGKNMMLRGSEGSFYFESYGGHKNLNEPIPMVQMDGQISYTSGNVMVTGVGTAFIHELRFGQKFMAGTPLQVFVVDDIIDDTHVRVQRPPDANGTDEDAYKPPHLFEIHNQRGTLIWGNAQKSDRGNIIAVGEGRLRLNGAVLPGDDFVASRRLKLAIFNPNTGNYTVDDMGFDTAPPASGVSVTIVAGGTKDMTQGIYSFRYAWADSTTGYGFSNPSDVIKLDAANDPIEITATKQKFRLDFTAALPSRPDNSDALIVYRSLYSDPTQNATQAAEGSWFVAASVRIADLEGGDILHIDVLDGELGTEITFDNDAPPDADWVTFLAGDPILISCYGDKVVGGSDRGSAPGPFVSPSRRGNRHGFPAATATVLSPPDTIIGFLPGVGRLFLLTRTGLPFAAATGQADFPVETRAFWQTGFKSPYGLVFINGTLYAFTHKGPTRSISTGDQGGEEFAFAAAVEEITRTWYAGYVHAVRDPQNEMIVLIYSASHRNDEGFWVSLALPYYLRYGIFGPIVEISKPGRDMIVTGAAEVGGKLQFLAGGRGTVDEFSSEESSEEVPSEESSEEEFDAFGPRQWLRPEELIEDYVNDDVVTLWRDASTFATDAVGADDPSGGDVWEVPPGPVYKTNIINGWPAVEFLTATMPGNDPIQSGHVLSLNISTDLGPSSQEMLIVVRAADSRFHGSWDFRGFGALTSHYDYSGPAIYEAFASTNRHSIPTTMAMRDTWRIYQVYSAYNDFAAYLDGVLQYSTATNSVAFAADFLGRSNFTSLYVARFAGYIAEYILWNRKLTTDERAEALAYAQEKYNL